MLKRSSEKEKEKNKFMSILNILNTIFKGRFLTLLNIGVANALKRNTFIFDKDLVVLVISQMILLH